MADPQALIEQYLAGELSQAEHTELSHWLSVDESHRQSFLAEVDFYRTVRGVLIEEQRELAKQAENDDSGIFDAQTLSALREIQAAAEGTPPVRLEPVKVTKAPRQPLPKLTPGMVLSLVPKRYFYGGIAAAFALAFVLIVLLQLVGPDNPETPLAKKSPAPATAPDAAAPVSAVAMLTAAHDARWGGPAASAGLATGDTLHPGDRLTLTQGFAEITTEEGAVVILEAPATVELLNNNALRLHAGKLVGICETPSSKGLLVRTPHTDVIDLGTRFGVEVSQSDATEVHVIEGLVEVASPAIDSSGPVRLSAQQAMRVDAVKAERVAFMPTRFDEDGARTATPPRFEGQAAQWLDRPPADLTLGKQTSKALQVFNEQAGLMLNQDIIVDFKSGHTWPESGIGKHTVAAGTRVDVYLLHLDTPGKFTINRAKYTVHFDRPILGVIGAASSLRATDAILGAPGVTYPLLVQGEVPNRETASGLDYPGGWGSASDPAQVVNNGTSLRLALTTGVMMDQVRVLVAADPTQQE